MKTLAEWLARKPTGKAPRRRVKPMSDRRKKAARLYSKQRAAFLAAHPYCQVWIERMGLSESALIQWHGNYSDVWGVLRSAPLATDIHHKAGRTGPNYLNEATWLAVCRDEHAWIHAHPSEARRRGWLL